MDVARAILRFEEDPTFFLRHRPHLHRPLLEIAKGRMPDAWVDGMPLWEVPADLIGEAVAVGPHGLLFVSNRVRPEMWTRIARHERYEAELVAAGHDPEEAHHLAKQKNMREVP